VKRRRRRLAINGRTRRSQEMELERGREVNFVTLVLIREETGLKNKDRGEIDHENDQFPTVKAKEKAKEAEGVSKSDGGRG
jgi:hypothetical protein